MVNDHLSDFVTRVRNGYMAGLRTIECPSTKLVENVANVLVETGYVSDCKKNNNVLTIGLKYANKKPAVMGIRRYSKPGARVYAGVGDLPRVWGGLGLNILSTPKGIMSDKKAKKLNMGGEVLAQVW